MRLATFVYLCAFAASGLGLANAHAQTAIACNTPARELPGVQDAPLDVDAPIDVTCPAGCGASPIWGTGLYSDDSSICSAAIHAGAMGADGGRIAVIIQAGQPSYAATTQNGITSLEWGEWSRSFEVVAVASFDCNQNAQALGADPGSRVAVACPAGCGAGSVWGSGIYRDDSSVCSAAIHAGVMAPEGGVVTILIAGGHPGYAASTHYGITTREWGRSFEVLNARPLVPQAPPDTLALECTQTAQSLPGDPGASFQVACPANCPMEGSIWGTGIYSDDSSICTAAVHTGVIEIGLGGPFSVLIEPGQPSYVGSTHNGVTTAEWGEHPRAFSVHEVTAGTPVECTTTGQQVGGGGRVICPAGCGAAAIWGTNVYSDDSSICSAAIHAGVMSSAGGAVRLTIAPGQPGYTASNQNGIASLEWGEWERSFVFDDIPPILTCDQSAQGLAGATGESIRIICPSDCNAGAIWGSHLYGDNSAVCTAAIHAGAISPQGGMVVVVIAPGQPSYAGSTQNGVISADFGERQRSFWFLTGPQSSPTP